MPVLGTCILATVLFSACSNEKKESSGTTTDTIKTPIETPVIVAPDTTMNRMDTGETKPIVPGT